MKKTNPKAGEKMKKIHALLSLFLALLMLLCACATPQNETSDTSAVSEYSGALASDETELTEPGTASDLPETDKPTATGSDLPGSAEDGDLILLKPGQAPAELVLPADATAWDRALADQISADIAAVTGVTLSRVTTCADDDRPQIVIGIDVCAQAAETYSKLACGQWVTCRCGKKLIVACTGQTSAETAAASVGKNVKKYGKTGELTYPMNSVGIASAEKFASQFPYLLNKAPTYSHAVGSTSLNTNAGQMVFEAATAQDFQTCLSRLSAIGAEAVGQNTAGKNEFRTYRWKTYLLNLSYLPALKVIRIVSEPLPKTLLYGDDGAKRTTSVLFAQPATTPDGDTMMAVVFRLADGRFFVYDTGYDYTADRLMNYMRSHNTFTDGKVHIAAIMISHPHPDHMNGLSTLVSKYASELKVEYVLYNFVSAERQSDVSASTLNSRRNTVNDAAKKLGATALTVRGGQCFSFAGTQFDLLFTPDELGTFFLSGVNEKGEDDTTYDMNNSSLILRVRESGQTLILTGDCRGGEAQIFLDMYPKDCGLSADIMSVAHHSFNVKVTSQIYDRLKPFVLIWTARDAKVDRTRAFTKALESASYVKEHYYQDTTAEFTLPYKGKK